MNNEQDKNVISGLYGSEIDLYEHFFSVAQPAKESEQPTAGAKGQTVEVKGSKNTQTLG